MTDKLILVLNCGSSSLKGAVLNNDNGDVLMTCLAEKMGLPDAYITFKVNGEKERVELAHAPNHTGAVEALLAELKKLGLYEKVGAIGHRVVSGGELYSDSVLITDEVIAGIEKCIPLAPLHNPAHLLGIHAARKYFVGLPNVAVFDTAFHQTMPEHAYIYAIPRKYYTDLGLRRYGAHGTSYRFVAEEAARFMGKDSSNLKLVIAHLGNGASIAAVRNGKCMDTSMGLTPLEGLVMGTRSGDIDPSVFSFLANNAGMNIQQITDMLNKESGLLGISGLSNDCRSIGVGNFLLPLGEIRCRYGSCRRWCGCRGVHRRHRRKLQCYPRKSVGILRIFGLESRPRAQPSRTLWQWWLHHRRKQPRGWRSHPHQRRIDDCTRHRAFVWLVI